MKKAVQIFVLVLLSVGILSAAGPDIDMPKLSPHQGTASTPELRRTLDETIVILNVNANNSPHVLCASSEFDRHRNVYVLHYVLTQNQDLFRRSRKRVTVEWRLRGYRGDGRNIEVRGAVVTFRTSQLQTLMPKPIRPMPMK